MTIYLSIYTLIVYTDSHALALTNG